MVSASYNTDFVPITLLLAMAVGSKIKTCRRDEIKLKMHLASMEAKQEYEEAEKKCPLKSQGFRYSR